MSNTPFSVVVPALNEEDAIGPLIDRLKALPTVPEIVVVNDGSTDRTAEIAEAKGAIVVHHPMPGGYGRAVKDGMAKAKNDVIVLTDADGTYPIEDIPKMVALFDRGYDMVVGARHGKHYRGTFLKMPARILLKWLVEFTTGRKIPDINSGFRVFKKSVAMPFSNDLCNGFSFTTTITLIFMLSGKFVEYMPIDYHARIGHSKVKIIRDSFRTLQYITEVIATYNPLKLYVLLAGALGFFGLLSVAGMFVFIDLIFPLFAAIFITGAFLVFGMGVLAHIHASAARRVR